MDEQLRTMLIIGATFADAAAFLGYDIGPTQEDAMAYVAGPRRTERASSSVPDHLWSPGEFSTAWLRGRDFTNENGSAPYDLVIVTAGAAAEVDARAWADELVKPDGTIWYQGGRVPLSGSATVVWIGAGEESPPL